MDQDDGNSDRVSAASRLAELLRRTAAGDGVAFRHVYESQVRRLNGVALRITADPALARDVLHDAFLEIWRNAAQFDPGRGAADTWMLSIVRHRAIAVVRRRRREDLGFEPTEIADDAPDPLRRLAATLEGEALARCLETLDIRLRQLIVLAYVDGLSHSQLAARLGLPLGTIKSSLRRSLEMLRKCLTR